MSKQYNIRWKQSDNDDLKKAVKNFNAKISRLEKKYEKEYPNKPYQSYALPKRVTTKELKEVIQSRQDLKRELKALRRFSERGAEELVSAPVLKNTIEITKWQRDEMLRRERYINKGRKKQYDIIFNLQAEDRGKPLGYTVGEIGMGETDKNELMPINAFTESMDRSGVHKRYRTLRRESQYSYWREKEMTLMNNVIKGIDANYSGLFPDEADELIKAIESMSFTEFYRKFKSQTGIMEIVSPPHGSNMVDTLSVNIEALKTTWLTNNEG